MIEPRDIFREYVTMRFPEPDRIGIVAKARCPAGETSVVVQVSCQRYRRANWLTKPSLCRAFTTWSEAVAYCDDIVTTDAPETLALTGRWRDA